MRQLRAGLAYLLLASFAAPALAGKVTTAPGKYKEWGEDDIDELEVVETFKFADYKDGVSVATLDVSKAPPGEGKEAKNVQEALAGVDKAFLDGVKKGLGSFSKGTSVQAGTPTGKALLIKATVIELNPGSKGARMGVGLGAGAAKAILMGEIVDAGTGKVLLRFNHEKRAGSGMGWGGGNSMKLMLKGAEHVGEAIGKAFKAF
jgi:hypothetical protein